MSVQGRKLTSQGFRLSIQKYQNKTMGIQFVLFNNLFYNDMFATVLFLFTNKFEI